MKLPTNTVEVTSNMVFDETFKVGIADDDEAVAMVIERLISTYKNPYRAALREYTSNAYDEHVQAGVSTPVEVSLPNEMSPVLIVQDFGRGLNREQLKGFGTIGKSTKRDSNETTGGFGMGSKCALAASPTFTVMSVQNGTRNTVVVARDENNIPHMQFLKEVETDDPNGTTITVPISDVSKFGDLKNFWLGWKPGSILVDGEEPKDTIYDETRYREVKGGYGWYDLMNVSSGQEKIRVMINQVYYELNYKDLGLDYKQWNVLKYSIIKIENGTVDIAPSREDLQYNARTKAAVSARTDAMLNLAAESYAVGVSTAPDIKTALTLLEKMKANGFPTDGIKYDGKSITLPGSTLRGNRIPDPLGTWGTPHRDYKSKTGWRVDKEWRGLSAGKIWQNNDQNKFVIVYGAGVPTAYGTYSNRTAHREAFGIGEYLSTMSGARNHNWNFFITSEPFKGVNRHYRDMADIIISAEEFNKVVKSVRAAAAKAAREARKDEQGQRMLRVLHNFSSYDVSDVLDYEAKDIAANYDYVVTLRNQGGGMQEILRESLMTKAYRNGTRNFGLGELARKFKVAVVLIGKNEKMDGLKDILPPIVTIPELAIKDIKAQKQKASKWDLMALRDRTDDSVSVFKQMDDSTLRKIKNKDTVKWAKAVRDFRDEGASIRAEYDWLVSLSDEVKAALKATRLLDTTTKTLPETPMNRYPLLRAVHTYSVRTEDVLDYINLRDSALTKG